MRATTPLAPLLAAAIALSSCAPRPVAPPAPEAAAPTPARVPSPVVAAPPPVAATRPPLALCGRGTVQPTPDGRVLGHLPYPDAPQTAVVPAPEPFAGGRCRVAPAMLDDLTRLLAAADGDPAVRGQLHAVSCHRSDALQRQTFCAGIGPDGSGSFAERAWASAPPGHSEHATGYVIDFGTRDRRACDADACFAATAAGRWLRDNAARFGFEMSFPAGNRQGVKWEPWHWRWVGTGADAAGAAATRATFRDARTRFPAAPAVD